MRRVLLALATGALLTSAATAAEPRYRAYDPPLPVGRDPDEVRDYRRDQMERRQEMEREALRFRQKVERRAWDDADDD